MSKLTEKYDIEDARKKWKALPMHERLAMARTVPPIVKSGTEINPWFWYANDKDTTPVASITLKPDGKFEWKVNRISHTVDTFVEAHKRVHEYLELAGFAVE